LASGTVKLVAVDTPSAVGLAVGPAGLYLVSHGGSILVRLGADWSQTTAPTGIPATDLQERPLLGPTVADSQVLLGHARETSHR